MKGIHEKRKWVLVEERVVFRNEFVGLRNDLVRRADENLEENRPESALD